MDRIDELIASKDFTNDILFKEVLTRHKDLCKELIQRCLPDLEIEEIEYVESEKELSLGLEFKRIRVDAYTSDTHRKYAIEMMTYRIKSVEKYSRYHQSLLDASLEIGTDPNELKDTILIILCTYDPLGYQLPVYTIQSRINEADYSTYEDGRRIVIVTPMHAQKASETIRPLVQLLAKDPGEDDFTLNIQKAVQDVKIKPEVRRSFMIQELRDQAIREEARRLGRKEILEKNISTLMDTLNITEAEAKRLLRVDEASTDKSFME